MAVTSATSRSVSTSGPTTDAASIVTVDGYTSRGSGLSSASAQDFALLQDFTVYLDLRLKCQNLSLLRRIFADFIQHHATTLSHLTRQGCSIISIFPVPRTSAKRRERAQELLRQPKKAHYRSAECVLQSLERRTATRGMALLRQLLEEFQAQRETSLRQFVDRGDRVISVIPFALPPSQQSLAPSFGTLRERLFGPVSDGDGGNNATRDTNYVGDDGDEGDGFDRKEGQVSLAMDTKRYKTRSSRSWNANTEKGAITRQASRACVVECTSGNAGQELGIPSAKAMRSSSAKTQKTSSLEVVNYSGDAASAACATRRAHGAVLAEAPIFHDTSAEGSMARAVRSDAPARQALSADAVSTDALLPSGSAAVMLTSRAIPADALMSRDLSTTAPTCQIASVETSTSVVALGEVPTSQAVPADVLVCRAVPAEGLTLFDSSHEVSTPRAVLHNEALTPQAVSCEAPTFHDLPDILLGPQASSTRLLTAPSAADDVLTSQDLTAGVPTPPAVSVDTPMSQPDGRTSMPSSAIVLAPQGLLCEATSSEALLSEALPTETHSFQSDCAESSVVAMHQRQISGGGGADASTNAVAGDDGMRVTGCSVSTELSSESSTRGSADARLPVQYAAEMATQITECVETEAAHLDVTTETTCRRRRVDAVGTANAKDGVNPGVNVSMSATDIMRKRGTMTPASCTLPEEGPVGPAPTQTESSSTAVEDMSSAAPSTPNEDPSSAASSTPVEDMSSATPSTPIEDMSSATPSTPIEDLSSATSSPVSSPNNSVPCNDIPTAALTGSQGKRMRKRTAEISNERPRKRDKLIVSEEKCRIQTDLAQKLKTFEAKAPWKTVYGNLPVPFDETEYPVLAKKFAQFWRRHSRAVWERNFWAPMSRKLNLADFNRRNNRQFTAKTAFESLIVSVYETFGAAFFVKLDTQKPRHPGWWYYGPVVALFALHQIKGEEAMWEYVTREVLERFPDCKLPVPLTAANSGAIRSRYKGESGSMWMANHYLTTTILREIDELKARQQVCEQS